jgi:hypothetical protein
MNEAYIELNNYLVVLLERLEVLLAPPVLQRVVRLCEEDEESARDGHRQTRQRQLRPPRRGPHNPQREELPELQHDVLVVLQSADHDHGFGGGVASNLLGGGVGARLVRHADGADEALPFAGEGDHEGVARVTVGLDAGHLEARGAGQNGGAGGGLVGHLHVVRSAVVKSVEVSLAMLFKELVFLW